ncbi:MAG: SDR family NAD(P)-dependent oxidoreductase [Candidatus Thiodiazotropha sp. (ex Cardiolucina cf. quadrata)]|nr:SDR family NAD(P)-dependent oxidoreductase [Candidatus Thiodiazotropha sp. (ex Cardiolucina cf. quadrata)]
MAQKLNDKVVIVTGGGSGIGRALCKLFAVEGAQVVIADIDRDAANETLDMMVGNKYPGVVKTLDVGSAKSWFFLHEQVSNAYGRCDVLCNNAGVFRNGEFDTAPLDDWFLQSRINIDGVILGCKTFAPDMVAQGRGNIVNTASLSGLLVAPGLTTTYTASKFAVVGYTLALRYELAEKGVQVSALCPGAIDTPMIRGIDVPTENRLVPPLEVAEKVVAAIKANDGRQFIFTHPEFHSMLEEQYRSVLQEHSTFQNP